MEPAVKEKNFFVKGEYVTAGLIGLLLLTIFAGIIFLFHDTSATESKLPTPSTPDVLGTQTAQVQQTPEAAVEVPAGPQLPPATPRPTAKPTSPASASPSTSPSPSVSATAQPSPSVSASPSPSPSLSPSPIASSSATPSPSPQNIQPIIKG